MTQQRAPWTRKVLEERIRKGLAIVDRALHATRSDAQLLDRAIAISERVERDHRGFGRRVFNASGDMRFSVPKTAQAMVLSYIARPRSEGAKLKRPASWAEVAETRDDVVLANAIHEKISREALAELRALGWSDFDYCVDITRG